MPVERMREVSQSAHAVDQVHCLFRRQKRRHATGDEKTYHLAFERLHLLSRDGELGCEPNEVEGAVESVVIGQSQAVDAALACSVDQLLKRASPVVRKVGVEMQVD